MGDGSGRIVASALTKRFGAVTAVDGLSFTVEPGVVTGFLGPNGAGKTTTLRMLLGLVMPDAGGATLNGRPYASLATPTHEVGAVLDATGFHPARSGRDHLRVSCAAAGHPDESADRTLARVGLAEAGRRPVRGYSLGMRQRLALATALLGDPQVLVLDEPANGLDPGGIAWLRGFLRRLADEGRTVLVSSHVLSEMQQLAEHVVIVHQGRRVRQGDLRTLTSACADAASVRTPAPDALVAALARHGVEARRVERTAPGSVRVAGLPAAEVGRLAFHEGVELHGLADESPDLEQVFFSLIEGEPPPRVERVPAVREVD
jgi:ABC-2 type transport system ATP-binding protein